MVTLGLFGEEKRSSSVNLSFRIPYHTHWGEHLLVSGSHPIFGSSNVKRGLVLKPSHRDEEMIWSNTLRLPSGVRFEYSYFVVDDEKNVLRSEAGRRRKAAVPSDARNGLLVEFRDLWQ
ncbi:hypothetical protein M569_06305, partial [Genlisea aurea]